MEYTGSKISFPYKPMVRFLLWPLAVVGSGLTGIFPVQAADPVFSDVTASAGIGHVVASDGDTDTSGGMAWIDIDNDGFQDLYVPNHLAGEASWLYHNVDDGSGNRVFVEIAGIVGSDAQDSNARGAGVAIGDVDGDGCDDIFVANGFGVGGGVSAAEVNTLLRNNFCDDGSLTFTDATLAASLAGDISNSMVASFGDVDSDGDLDLYVGNYMPDGGFQSGLCESNNLYLNDGSGEFTETGLALGVADEGCILASAMTDFDGDGDLDIYVVNDFSSTLGGSFVDRQDAFYRNNGTDAAGVLLAFTKATEANVADAANGMGIGIGDYDNDGDLDYYGSSFSFPEPAPGAPSKQNVLNRNNGNGVFSEVADAAGVADRISPITGDPMISWGAVFFDADNDGYLDLYKTNGRVQGGFSPLFFTDVQPNRLYMNNHDSTFREVGSSAGVDGEVPASFCVATTSVCFDQSRGTAVADYDNDGDVDVFVHNLTSFKEGPQPPRLYRNDTVNSNDWLQLRLSGTKSNRRAIGAKVRVTSTGPGGTMTQLREVGSGSSHGSSNAFPVQFGFPAGSAIDFIAIEWPSGVKQTLAFDLLALNQVIPVTENPFTDVLLAQRALVGKLAMSPALLAHFDVAPVTGGVPVADGIFNVADVVAITRRAMGLLDF